MKVLVFEDCLGFRFNRVFLLASCLINRVIVNLQDFLFKLARTIFDCWINQVPKDRLNFLSKIEL